MENPYGSDSLVSIIVPIYNVDLYIDKCIKSITEQNYNELQILLIDDGSWDESAKKCEMWQAKDSRISYYRKENSGVGTARNYGIDLARGRYIAFVDADDWIAPDFIEKLVDTIKSYQADIVACNVRFYYEEEDCYSSRVPHQKFHIVEEKEMKEYILFTPAYFCNKLFTKEMFADIRFPNCFFEDTSLFPIIVSRAGRIVQIEDKLYYYLKDRGGSTTNISERYFDIVASMKNTLSYFMNERLYDEFREVLGLYFLKRIQMFNYRYKEDEHRLRMQLEKCCGEIFDILLPEWKKILNLKFCVFGSYNARWIIHRLACSKKDLKVHICFSSLISQMLGNITNVEIEYGTQFRRKMARQDVECYLHRLLKDGEFPANYIVIDFLEERRSVLELLDGNYVTESEVYEECLQDRLNIARRIHYGSEEFWEMWKEACDELVYLLGEMTANIRIILLKMRLAECYKKDNVLEYFSDQEDIKKKNLMIAKMENYLLSKYKEIKYIETEQEFLADNQNTKGYGCSPEYLSISIYKDYAEKLWKYICGSA